MLTFVSSSRYPCEIGASRTVGLKHSSQRMVLNGRRSRGQREQESRPILAVNCSLQRFKSPRTYASRGSPEVFALVIPLAGASSACANTILNYQITGPRSFTASFTLPQHGTPSAENELGTSVLRMPWLPFRTESWPTYRHL